MGLNSPQSVLKSDFLIQIKWPELSLGGTDGNISSNNRQQCRAVTFCFMYVFTHPSLCKCDFHPVTFMFIIEILGLLLAPIHPFQDITTCDCARLLSMM